MRKTAGSTLILAPVKNALCPLAAQTVAVASCLILLWKRQCSLKKPM